MGMVIDVQGEVTSCNALVEYEYSADWYISFLWYLIVCREVLS